jgi:5-methylcytosine-specific restriction endonuclease McrA
MNRLELPQQSSAEVIDACVNHMRPSNAKHAHAIHVKEPMKQASRTFEQALSKGAQLVSQLNGTDYRSDVTADNDTAIYLYDQQFCRHHEFGYDDILGIRDCAYCSCTEATTLDHFLPKSVFPNLSVTPLNLIPCCSKCNQHKSNSECLNHPELVPFNPYVDDFDDQQWLSVTIDHHTDRGAVPTFSFNVTEEKPEKWSVEQFDRLNNMFVNLQLGKRYARQVIRVLNDQRIKLRQLFEEDPSMFRTRLLDQSNPANYGNVRNDWHVVAFSTAAADDWFCGDGARLWFEIPSTSDM